MNINSIIDNNNNYIVHNICKYYIAGTTAGVIATICTQPLDRLKVQLQNSIKIDKNFFSIKNLYKGAIISSFGYGIEKSIVYGTSNTLSNIYGYNNMFSGFLSGIVVSFISTPVEQFKIDKQLSNKICYSILYLYKALPITMIRESLGFCVYFGVYKRLNNVESHNFNIVKTGFYGGISALCAWLVIYPIDTYKTLQQSNNIKSFKIINSYKGIQYGLLRALPFHSLCFIIYEYTNIFLSGKYNN